NNNNDYYENDMNRSIVMSNNIASNGLSYPQLQQPTQPFYPQQYPLRQHQPFEASIINPQQQGYTNQQPNQPSWLPYGIPINQDPNTAGALQMHQNSKSSSNSNNNNNTTNNNIDTFKPQNGYNLSTYSQQKNDKKIDSTDTKSQVSSISNFQDHNTLIKQQQQQQQQKQQQNNTNNTMANPYMYQYQYPYYMQEQQPKQQQQQQQPGIPLVQLQQQQPPFPPPPPQPQTAQSQPLSQPDMTGIQHVHPQIPQNPNSFSVQHQFQYPFQSSQPYFQQQPPPPPPPQQHPSYM
ncbi:hypothetical protein C6P42_004671, partial [Pichia californica]